MIFSDSLAVWSKLNSFGLYKYIIYLNIRSISYVNINQKEFDGIFADSLKQISFVRCDFSPSCCGILTFQFFYVIVAAGSLPVQLYKCREGVVL